MTYYYSNYNYNINFQLDAFHIDWTSNLREHSIKADFGAYLNPRNTMKFGFHTIFHEIRPADMKSFGEDDEVIDELVLEPNKSYEHAVYINNEQQIGNNLVVDYGIRYSLFQNLGPQEVYRYDSQYEITDTIQHSGKVYNSAGNFEPRIGLRYQLNRQSSLKASYNRTAQYIHLVSNGNFASPFDVWFPSSERVKPQQADQYALGYFRNFKDNAIEFSAEVYYKDFQNSIDFKDHADLALNTNLEGELRFGEMRAYGLELMAKKNAGKLTGWISYTLSKTEKR